MTLLKAKQISNSDASASQATPIIVIEEPESFLHPSAQAEFGRVLQDLSNELEVQVIVTTHSPYMLSVDAQHSNILLERNTYRSQLRETKQIDTTGKNWMEPFALSLGITPELFEPWRDLLLSANDCILLVEGKTDKEYLKLLQDESHGKNKLQFSGEIFTYNGKDNLKNTVLLRFIKRRYKQILITFDLDALSDVEKHLKSLV